MAEQVVLKNIYHFLQTLEHCHTAAVAGWGEAELSHALQWAAYSEEIYQRALGRPYFAELNQQIEQLGQLPWALGGITVNLELLSSAGSVIKKTLLQSPCVTTELSEALLKTYNIGEAAGKDNLIKDCYELTSYKAAAHIASVHLSGVRESSLLDADEEADARLILLRVHHVLTNRTEAFLRGQLGDIFQDKMGAGRLLRSLFVDPSTIGKHAYLSQQWILHTILDFATGEHRRNLWSLPADQLALAAAFSPEFHQLYLEFVKECASQFHPEYDQGAGKICWRASAGDITFEMLLGHVQGLLNINKYIASETKTKLLSLSHSTRGAIWKYLLKRCS